MATIYSRPDSHYYFAKFFDADGKRVSKNTGQTKKREAQKEAERMEAESREQRAKSSQLPKALSSLVEAAVREAASGDLTLSRAEALLKRARALANPDFKEVTFTGWFQKWCDDQVGMVAESTVNSYNDAKKAFDKALGARASKNLTEITYEDTRKAHAKIREGVKASTANLYLRFLRRAIQAAVDQGLCAANVAKKVKAFPEDDSSERAPFAPEEVAAMILHNETPDEWIGMTLLGSNTGLRLRDVVELGEKNLTGSILVIRPRKSAKTRKTLRIPLSPACLEWIGERKGDWFPELRQKTTATLSTQFRRIMAKAGVSYQIELPGGIVAVRSFHCLRHSFTSWLADENVPADVRQKLTGHKSAGVHAIYTHHDKALLKAIESLPDMTKRSRRTGLRDASKKGTAAEPVNGDPVDR